jgi:hypothetical protein
MKSAWNWSALVVVAILALQAPCASAQVTGFAQLNGTVRDESGGSVAKASFTLREMDTNRVYTATSNDSGFYVLPSLPPGRYELKVAYTGFASYTQTGITLSVGQTATIDVTLKVASRGEQVTVTGEAPPVEPSRTEISQVIDSNQIGSLPISGRLFTDFALLTPGVATGRTSLQSTFTEFEVTRVSFGGMRDFSNIVTVDGADTINTVTSSQRGTPSQEAVSEFRVVNNSFGADYGRALGGIVNIVTKSGTNEWHGSVYDYLQNNATNARSLLLPAPLPNTLRQNQFGVTLGGPIKKDKTFIFMNYEGQRRGEAPTFPATLRNDLTLINLAKTALLPNTVGGANENLNVLKTADTDNGFIKLDHQLTDKHRLTVRYNVLDARDLNVLVGNTLDGGGIGAPSSGHNLFLRDQSVVAMLSSQLKPNFINTFLFQFAHRSYDFPGVTGQPNLDIPNSLLFGHNFGVFDFIGESRLQFSDTVSWVKGSHVVNFGVDTNFLRDKVLWPGFTPMRIIVPGINCLVAFANFVNPAAMIAPSPNPGDVCPLPPVLNGVPIIFWGAPLGNGPVAEGSLPPVIPTTFENAFLPSRAEDFRVHLNHSYYGFFAQDQWKVTPKLTMNYGLRWDFEGGLTQQVKHDLNNFAPRFGLAYSPDKHTVIRAGGGLFYDRYNLGFFFVTSPQRPPSQICHIFDSTNTAIAPGAPCDQAAFPGSRQGANTAGYSLNQDPTVPGGPGFLSNAAVDARNFLVGGMGPGGPVAAGQVPPNFFFPPNPATTGRFLNTVAADGVDPNSRTSYSEQASLEIDREIGRGLTVSAGYLFVSAHKLVRAENLNVSCPVGATQTRNPKNDILVNCTGGATLPNGKALFNGPEYNAGLFYFTDNSGNSIYHGFTLQASEKAGKYFRLNANYTFSKTLDDGTFTTFVSTPQNLFKRNLERANSNQDVRHRFIANFVATGPEKTFLRQFEVSSIITAQAARPFTIFAGFDVNNDTNPVTDRVGLAARNTYFGDKLVSADLRLSRYFRIKERMRIQVIAEVFNLFNRANVDEVFSVYFAPDFIGGTPRHYKDGVADPANPGFGSPRTTFNPRQLQFAAKLSF